MSVGARPVEYFVRVSMFRGVELVRVGVKSKTVM